ncbi:hypothetical protein ACMDCT_01005 [Halomonadaceae bacterium KBTZ08]
MRDEQTDVRWLQRLNNFRKALARFKDGNLTSHAYNEETANAILANIQSHYHGLLNDLERTMASEAERHGFNN